MAIYHLSAKIISRKAGRSATAAAAYRAGVEITDERTGEIHDYRRKAGVEHAEIVIPSASDWEPTRAELWNAAELKNKRADAQVAREFVVALPDELSTADRQRLAVDFAREIADRYSVAADVAIHAPSRDGDDRNHHAHILTTTNRVEGHKLGNKARELDLVAHNMGGKIGQANEIDRLRARWAELTNERLRDAGHEARIDHRSHAERGIEAEPTQHLGPTATAIERRTGEPSRKRQHFDQEAAERLVRAREAGELERRGQALDRAIIDTTGDLRAALRERDQLQAERDRQKVQRPTTPPPSAASLASGMADFRAQFEAAKLVEAGKQQAREAFERFKAEQRAADLARQQAAERAAQELVRQREDAERQRQADQERQQSQRGGPEP